MYIRRLNATDAAAYRALMLEAYALHPDAFTSSVAERTMLPLAWWQARLTGEPHASQLVMGAFTDDQIAGVAGLSFETREKVMHKATLIGMYVPLNYRRQGVGRQLVRALLAEARSFPRVRVMQLTVTQGNRDAQALYEQCGFVQFGVEPFAVAVATGFVSKIHMWCDLNKLG